jgi:hypothetical protein
MKYVKKNIDILLVLILCLTIILFNFDFAKLVIGLDNASPYFGISNIISRIKGISSVIYGGILFQAPFLLLKELGIKPEILSNLYLSLNLVLGSLGITLLSRKFTKNRIVSLFSTIVLVTSLFTTWIFANPNFLFLASYGSIPLIIYFLSKEKLKTIEYIFLVMLSLIFLTTTLNIVAFAIYLLQIVLLTKVLTLKEFSLKRVGIWSCALVLVWLFSIQIIMFLNRDTSLFITQIFAYISSLLKNPYMDKITEGILTSGKSNSILDTARFSTGWMELHDPQNIPIFTKYTLYKTDTVYMFLGLIPFLLSLLSIYFKRNRRNILLTSLLLFFVLLSSKFGIYVIESIPLLKYAIRWPTSKLWPIYIIPLTVLSGITLSYILKLKKIISYPLIGLLFGILIFYSLPVLNGNLLSPTTKVNIPNEYFKIPSDSKILVLPKPQKLYMREYEWGYYGSDFLSYINTSQIVDGANLYEYSNMYENIFESGYIPKDIEYTLYDRSAEIHLDSEIISKSEDLLQGYEEIISNKYFTIYGREQ